MAERSRIAQDIHDHVGHELSGAAMALQAALKLYERGDARAGELLRQADARLQSSSGHLREAVHNLKPAKAPGAWSLEEACGAFSFCQVSYSASGDLGGNVNWDLLAVCLKELLTNIARHSGASLAAVRLNGNLDNVRLIVMDNGGPVGAYALGMGLSGMTDRVRNAGGSLTVNTSEGFQVVCVIPKVKEG